MGEKLTAKQQRFCEEYLIDLNATQAATRAGYSGRTAYRTGCDNLMKPQIAEVIQKRIGERSERTKVDADYVLTSIKEVAERCMQASPVMVRGIKVARWLNPESTALTAQVRIELLNCSENI